MAEQRKPKVVWHNFNELGEVVSTELLDVDEWRRRSRAAKQKHEGEYRRPKGDRGLAVELALNKRAREIFELDRDMEREAFELEVIATLMRGKAWSSEANAPRREIAEGRRDYWQQAADEIWKRNPRMGKSDVARLILKLPDLPAHMRAAIPTIRKAIQKK